MKELLYKSKMILKLTIQNNTLKIKNEELEKIVKEKLYKDFNKYLDNEVEIIKLREDNRNLRRELKDVKSRIDTKTQGDMG